MVQDRSKRTVEAILQAAAQVFTQRGYAGGTTNHIAERAGVSIGTLYQYFPNNDALLVALVQRHMEEGSAVLRELFERVAARPPPLEQLLRELVEAMVSFNTRDPKLHRLLFEEAPHPRAVRKTLERIEETMAERVEELLLGHPQASSRNAKAAAYIAVHVVEGLAHHFVLHAPRELDAQVLITETVALLRGYLVESARAQ